MTSPLLPAWDCHTHVFADPALRPPVAKGAGYTPPLRRWQDLERTGAPHGIDRYVLVQPSVYGTDNSLLLEALRQSAGRMRGVLVLDEQVSEADLQDWSSQGARGVRFNVVSGGGNGMASYGKLAPQLRQAGWHAQFFVHADALDAVHELTRQDGPAIVLDHLGGAADGAGYAEARTALFRLLDSGRVWVKASGFYRYGYPVREWPGHFAELLRTLGERYPERVVWASDWPHTWFFDPAQGPVVAYGDLLDLLKQSVDSKALDRILRANPAALYERAAAA